MPIWGRQRLPRTGSLKETSAHNQDGTRPRPLASVRRPSAPACGGLRITHYY